MHVMFGLDTKNHADIERFYWDVSCSCVLPAMPAYQLGVDCPQLRAPDCRQLRK